MIGAIIGDIVGSRFEWANCKSRDFELFTKNSTFTDDSVLTIALAHALTDYRAGRGKLTDLAIQYMQRYGRGYPSRGYGSSFAHWLVDDNPLPYNSFGNGAAMRVSACAWAAKSYEEAIALSDSVTVVTHSHPEGIKGARATTTAIFMARAGNSQDEIRTFINDYFYPLDFTLDGIRLNYGFDGSCQGTVPQAIEAFLEADSFEETIRNAISIGGDSDTLAAIAGSIAEAYFGVPQPLREMAFAYLGPGLASVILDFEAAFADE